MMKSMSGTTATIGAWLLALSSTRATDRRRSNRRAAPWRIRHLRRELVHDCLRLHAVRMLAFNVMVGSRERRQIVGCSIS